MINEHVYARALRPYSLSQKVVMRLIIEHCQENQTLTN